MASSVSELLVFKLSLKESVSLFRYQILAILAGLLFINHFHSKSKYRSAHNPKGLPLPPGPPGLPIIGNIHQILGKSIVPLLEQWAKEYGPIIHIRLFGLPVLILSSSPVAKELLETRHQKYSGRPNFLLASEAMQDSMMMPFIHANERFKRVRKLLVTELRPTAVTEYFHPVQSVEIHRLVNNIIHDAKDWRPHLSRAIASIIMTTVYDRPIKSGRDAEQVVKNVGKLNDQLVEAIEAGKNTVDFLPWLRYVPFAPYKKYARDHLNLAESTYKRLMDDAKANLEAGKPARSIAARLLQTAEEQEANYREQYWALGSLYLASSDTQKFSSQILMYAQPLIRIPWPYLDADALPSTAEVDSVVGPDKLPTYDDEPRLPYIKATVRELFRWRPVGPTAIPHASTEDDEFMGYHIPSGAMIIPNVVSMHMNPSIFDDPETFNPQRYIDDPSLPGHVFGFGRRACPGRAVAEETIFMVLAMVVWGLNVRKEKDESGMEKEIDTDRGSAFAPGGVMKPYGFHVSINSRSVERAKLLAAVVEAEGL